MRGPCRVAERIGQDPLVLRPLNEIGRYGGTIRRAYLGVSDYKNAPFFCAGPDCLLYWNRTRSELTPWVAKGYELSPDGMEMLLHLRRGMRWSDGEPFTAEELKGNADSIAGLARDRIASCVAEAEAWLHEGRARQIPTAPQSAGTAGPTE